MRILVAGANGFVGGNVMATVPPSVEAIPARRDQLDGLAALRPDVVINLAWPACDYASRMDDAIQVQGRDFALRLFALTMGRGVKFVGIGSQAERTTPDTPYARRKNETRAQLATACEAAGMPFAWIRLFSIYGPGDCPNTYISYLVRELSARREPALTDQDAPWDYLHVEDAARAIWTVALSPDATGEFDLGSGETVSTQTVARMVRDRINPALSLGFGRRQRRAVEVPSLRCDIGRLRALGWRPQIGIGEGLDSVICNDTHRNPTQPNATNRTNPRGPLLQPFRPIVILRAW